MKLEMRYKFEVRDKDGKVVASEERECNSAVLAFLDILAAKMRGKNSTGILDTGNVSRAEGTNSIGPRLASLAADITYGPVVGTGSTAVALADYKLETQILEGVGAGQLSHQAVQTTEPVTSGTTRRFTVTRVFTNTSGGSITVTEVGLYGCDATAGWYFCLERTVLGSSYAIANEASALLTYTISITV